MKVTFSDYTVLILTALAPFSLPIYYYIGVLLIYAGLKLAKKQNDTF